jgi:hypothetical protein
MLRSAVPSKFSLTSSIYRMYRFIKSIHWLPHGQYVRVLNRFVCSSSLQAVFCFSPLGGQRFQGSIESGYRPERFAESGRASHRDGAGGTEFSRSSRNLHDGSDHIPLLPPGRNHVETAKGGFETLSQGPITLLVNAHLKIDFHMSVGAQATTCLFVVQIEQKCGA